MSVRSPARQQSVFQQYHSEKKHQTFTHKSQLASKFCHLMYTRCKYMTHAQHKAIVGIRLLPGGRSPAERPYIYTPFVSPMDHVDRPFYANMLSSSKPEVRNLSYAHRQASHGDKQYARIVWLYSDLSVVLWCTNGQTDVYRYTHSSQHFDRTLYLYNNRQRSGNYNNSLSPRLHVFIAKNYI